MSEKTISPAVMRSMLGRVRGLGSAKAGTEHRWGMIVSSLALLPLTLWFVCSVIRLAGLPRAAVVAWAASPVVATLLVSLIVATFYHMQLGLQAVIDDYVHDKGRHLATLLLMKGVVWLLALAALIAALKLAVG